MSPSPGPDPEITDEEILDVFRSTSDPVLTTSEVAAEFDLSHRGVRNRLEKLNEEGTIKSKKVGARGKVWWDPEHVTVSDP